MKINPTFNVRRLRQRLGMSQAELAVRLETTEREIRRWEREGITPRRQFVTVMRKLESDKFDGTVAERPVTKADLPRRRKIPAPSAGTGQLPHIGIAPSSGY